MRYNSAMHWISQTPESNPMPQSLRQRFGTIRWKLTASYALVTLLVMLIMEALLLMALSLYATRVIVVPERMALASRDIAQFLQAEFEAPDRSVERLADQLDMLVRPEDQIDEPFFQIRFEFPEDVSASETGHTSDYPPHWQVPVVALLDTEGRVLTATLQSYQSGMPLVSLEVPDAAPIITRAISGITDTERLAAWAEPGNQVIVASPVFSRKGEVVGAVYARLQRPPIDDIVDDIPTLWLASAIPFLLISGVIGLIFGLFAGRDFSTRLKRLSDASAALATGDLTQRIDDSSVDEIGQLARQFNIMSERLAENLRDLRLLAEKNAQLAEQAAQLATIEERNRLARELHDSVSQELFSLTMLAAASRRLFERQPQVAAEQLNEIQETAQRALQETRSLIFALRPAQLDNRGLGAALRDLVSAVRERQGLEVDLTISGERHLPLEHEQALFRIVQEALANVVRHSGVRCAQVDLVYTDTYVDLQVADQGRGFDATGPRNARSIGLTSMQERTAALTGTFQVTSTLDVGTCVKVVIPVPLPLPRKGTES